MTKLAPEPKDDVFFSSLTLGDEISLTLVLLHPEGKDEKSDFTLAATYDAELRRFPHTLGVISCSYSWALKIAADLHEGATCAAGCAEHWLVHKHVAIRVISSVMELLAEDGSRFLIKQVLTH